MDISSVISKSDDRLFTYLAKETLTGLFIEEDPKKPNDKLPLILLGLIVIVGTEPFKVLLRSNIGKWSLSLPRLVAASFLYFLWAGMIYYFINSNEFENTDLPILWVSNTSLWAALAFYVIFPIAIMILGLVEHSRGNIAYNKNKRDIALHIYRGDSLFFRSLLNSGWTPQRIWVNREPLICFLLGIIITGLNPFMGLPILGTSISFWFNEYFQVNNVLGCLDEKMNRLQRDIALGQAYHKDDEDLPIVRSN